VIGIIDYGAGNIASVRNALAYIGQEAIVITDPRDMERCDALVFPGVGSFGAMVENLRQRMLYEPLYEQVRDGTPYLGICLGLHLLFEGSDESPDYPGFGLLEGRATRFTQGKVPQIGWNHIDTLIDDMPEGWAYYVNSYRIASSRAAIATSDYHGTFVAAVRSNTMTAFQFHPEKSGPYGLSLLQWWLSCLQRE
jgi:imidazole glycerol phosphate synthase glutamine amidotransferase subunit